MMTRVIVALLAAAALSGCLEPRIRPETGFNADFLNDAQGYYRIHVEFDDYEGLAGDPFFPGGLGGHGFSCGRRSPDMPASYPSTMTVRLFQATGPNHNGEGPLVFEGIWTGLECSGAYIFRLLDDQFTVEAYEVDAYKKTWPPWDRGAYVYKRGDDLSRVSP